MRKSRQHALLTLAATLLGAVAGACAGYSYGRAIALKTAREKLDRDAIQIQTAYGAYMAESHSVIRAIDASPFPACSPAELAYMRDLIFHAEYLRDAGRMREGRIECSAALGREVVPLTQFKPDIAESDGTKVYRDLPPYKSNAEIVFTTQEGDAFVVRDPRMERYMDGINKNFTYTVFNTATQTYGRLSGMPPQLPGAVTDRDASGRIGDTLYATRCAKTFPGCITAFSLASDAVTADRVPIFSFSAMAGLSAAFVGLLFAQFHRRRSSPVAQLRRAIADDKLRVLYQPIVNLPGRRIVGAEALVRWTDQEGFAVSPEIFVPLAERHGFVGDVTRLVVRHALRDFGATLRNHSYFRLNINVAAADLSDPQFLPMLAAGILKAEISPQSVAIEITESSTAKGPTAMATILSLRDTGYSVHIDDFGTGYSSLSYLQDLAVDAIKIDRTFTMAIGTGAAGVAILPRILGMADALNLEVIVEGIENERQVSYFATSGQPVLAQGWLFGRPMPAEAFHLLHAKSEASAHPGVALN